jgi:hypothetical protein
MSVYAANVTGSIAYWFQRQGELVDTFNAKGTGTILFTLSFADLHWPELQRLLETESAPLNERVEAVKNNPHIASWLFVRRVDSPKKTT